MKIRILSDLHREFGSTEIPGNDDCDLIILAGDISTKLNGLSWVHEFCRNTPAVYICGNHEFYGDKLPRVTEKLIQNTKGSSIHVMENDFFKIQGWWIYGCTLWTDLELVSDWQTGASYAGECMNDYKRIRNSSKGYRKLAPFHTRSIHLNSVVLLKKFLDEHDPAKTIVVTHHAPSKLSLPGRRREQNISCAYASNLDDLIQKYQPHLWIHGHIHHNVDYKIGNTRVLSNPQGYPDEQNPEFVKDLVVEL